MMAFSPRGGVDEDGGGSGGVGAGEDVLGVDSLGAVEGAGDLAEGVGAEFADEADVCSGAGGGYGLVGAFAAGPELKGLTHAGLAPGREAVDAEGDVGDVAAHDGDAVVGHSVDLSAWGLRCVVLLASVVEIV